MCDDIVYQQISQTWRRFILILSLAFALFVQAGHAEEAALVIQTDFGTKDGAVSAMKGAAFGVSPNLKQFDLTHEIPAYNVWEAAYRLKQTAPFWPSNTVFVSVVDPGVGTERKAVVLKTKSGHYFVTPDNGTLTFIAEDLGVAELREIDVARQRRAGSSDSYTFHGRDVFAFVGAKLATKKLTFADVGPLMKPDVIRIPYQHAEMKDGVLQGNVPVLDVQYGNVWSNIEKPLFEGMHPQYGDQFEVKIWQGKDLVYTGVMPYTKTFGDVPLQKPLLYLNSLLSVSVALNQGDFAKTYRVVAGPDCHLVITKLPATK